MAIGRCRGDRVALAGEDTIVGITGLRPNPRARVYIRIFESEQEPRDLNRDEIMRATLRAARLMQGAYAPTPEVFEEATLDAFAMLTPEERAAVAVHNRHMLALLERAERAAGTSAGP